LLGGHGAAVGEGGFVGFVAKPGARFRDACIVSNHVEVIEARAHVLVMGFGGTEQVGGFERLAFSAGHFSQPFERIAYTPAILHLDDEYQAARNGSGGALVVAFAKEDSAEVVGHS